MRKTSVRKFIHMIIDILPLLIIPIFALNILHKETEPISIEVQEKESIDFNQIYENGNIDTLDGYTALNGTIELQDNILTLTPTSLQNQFRTRIEYRYIFPTINHKYLFRFNIYCNKACYGGVYANGIGGTNNYVQFEGNSWQTLEFVSVATTSNQQVLYFGNEWEMNTNNYLKITKLNVFDLTQMFGVNNEPSVEEFNLYFQSTYYNYTESQKMLVNKPSPTTYNNTDIGSQFVYALYKPVNDYFNFNNLFNMGAIYNWIELNLFSGTAPLPIFIIWNVIVYEFFVDLIFLLYGVFMFIIDFAEKCLEKPFRR